MQIAIVNDDEDMGTSLVNVLGASGHRSIWCRFSAVPAIFALHADVILLDLGQQEVMADALDRLSRISAAPVIVLLGEIDRFGLAELRRVGADDFLVKPIRPDQLLAQIEQVAHRAAMRAKRVVTALDVTVNLGLHGVWVGDKPIPLTAKEFEVLAMLAYHAGQVVSRRSIEDAVWGRGVERASRSLNVHMATLRAKLDRPTLIQTVHGFGYRFGEPTGGPAAEVRAELTAGVVSSRRSANRRRVKFESRELC